MIPAEDHILPRFETPMNKALAALSTRLEGLNAPTREVWDPWRCPEPFLKVLAHALSVDIWNDAWTETRKRRVLANAIRVHRAKGTLEGIRAYLEFVDAKLLDVVTVPQRVFSGPSLTREEREAWLEKLPQVRTWRVRDRGKAGFGMFSGNRFGKRFFEGKFCIPSTAMKRLDRRARWVVGGQETDTRVSQAGSYFRLHIKGRAGAGVFSAGVQDGHCFTPSTARKRLVTISPTPRLAWRSAVTPRLEAVTSEPERVVVRGREDRGVFCNGFTGAGFYRPTSAIYRIFWRFAVNDGSRVARRRPVQFMGEGRYGFPAHTAYLETSMPGKRKPWAAGDGITAIRKRFWLPHDGERTRNARRALTASKRASDKLLIRYADRPQIIAGQMFRAGIDTFIVGRPQG